MLSLNSQCMRKSYCEDGLSGLYPADVGYGLLEASPGGCACCSPDLDFRRRGGRLINTSEASTSGRTITTHAMATAPAEPVEGPEALQAYLDRRIELFEHFKLRDTEAVKFRPTSVYQKHGTILLRLGGCNLSTPVLGTMLNTALTGLHCGRDMPSCQKVHPMWEHMHASCAAVDSIQ